MSPLVIVKKLPVLLVASFGTAVSGSENSSYWHLAPARSADCDFGRNAGPEECEAAVASLAAKAGVTVGGPMQLRTVHSCYECLSTCVVYHWDQIPDGCSVQTGGDWRAYCAPTPAPDAFTPATNLRLC